MKSQSLSAIQQGAIRTLVIVYAEALFIDHKAQNINQLCDNV